MATLTGVLVVFGIWPYNHFYRPLIDVEGDDGGSYKLPVGREYKYDIITQVTYGGLHRLAWGAALAWVVYACHHGYGG